MPEELVEHIRIVALARIEAKTARDTLTQSNLEWQKANQPFIASLFEADKAVSEAEAKLRELTLKAYGETGSKQPAKGVGIREVTKFDYDPEKAFEWALEHKMALSLNQKSFEGIVKATPLDFVRVYTEPQATISGDLSYILSEKGGES